MWALRQYVTTSNYSTLSLGLLSRQAFAFLSWEQAARQLPPRHQRGQNSGELPKVSQAAKQLQRAHCALSLLSSFFWSWHHFPALLISLSTCSGPLAPLAGGLSSTAIVVAHYGHFGCFHYIKILKLVSFACPENLKKVDSSNC